MTADLGQLLLILIQAALVLLGAGVLLVARRIWVRHCAGRHSLHIRLLRAELMQALARDESAFLIGHWTQRDRRAAFEVAAQTLTFLKGRERIRLEAIVEANKILLPILLRINRQSQAKRIATIRSIAPFGNRCVQGTLARLMQDDPCAEVRLEAAIAITVAGELPAPWHVIRSVCQTTREPTPNHFRLFAEMMPATAEAMLALVDFHDDPMLRLLAIHALGFDNRPKTRTALQRLLASDDADIVAATQTALERLSVANTIVRAHRPSAVINLADRRAA